MNTTAVVLISFGLFAELASIASYLQIFTNIQYIKNEFIACRNDGYKPTSKWPRCAMMDFVIKIIKTQNHSSAVLEDPPENTLGSRSKVHRKNSMIWGLSVMIIPTIRMRSSRGLSEMIFKKYEFISGFPILFFKVVLLIPIQNSKSRGSPNNPDSDIFLERSRGFSGAFGAWLKQDYLISY